MKKSDEAQPIIIKKIKKGGGGHHGGAWKVAYADFVTAMMAFFLLLWLLNVTTNEAKDIISNYFDPTHPKVSQATSGAGGVMGGLSMTKEGAMAEMSQPLTQSQATGKPANSGESTETFSSDSSDETEKLEAELKAREDERFARTKSELESAVKDSPDLQDMVKHLMIDVTPEGLRIQIIDQDGDPMFPSGSAQMYDKTRKLLLKVSELIANLPNDISVRGHTDSVPYSGAANYTNWELSADRANASRRIMTGAGLPEKRFANVMGKAATDPFLPKTPADARNRRISILLLRQTVEQAAAHGEFGNRNVIKREAPANPAPKPYQKSQGAVQFP